jgi:hypothetical protein
MAERKGENPGVRPLISLVDDASRNAGGDGAIGKIDSSIPGIACGWNPSDSFSRIDAAISPDFTRRS